MNRTLIVTILIIISLFAVSCAPKKVLIANEFMGENKTAKLLMLPRTDTVSSGKENVRLFNYYLRICNLTPDNKEENCKDTLILENVNPRSLY
ncbi:MAG: hypothetical protein N2746_00810 [Deltaproteobacteria bacterium]|nr:hypothetical protein [Deltaproteobacteria bacterium]